MAPYRQTYNFTGEPDANEDAAGWLSALEINIYSCMSDRAKVKLFSSKLWRGSPAKEWYNVKQAARRSTSTMALGEAGV